MFFFNIFLFLNNEIFNQNLNLNSNLIQIQNCKFLHCISNLDGGGIYLNVPNNLLIIILTLFYKCKSGINYNGGGIYFNSLNLTITKNCFEFCESKYGPSIYLTGNFNINYSISYECKYY